MFQKPKSGPTVILSNEPLLADDEITSEILALSARQYQALVELIDLRRQDAAAHAATSAENNNPLAMSKDNGAYEELTRFLLDLNNRRADQGQSAQK